MDNESLSRSPAGWANHGDGRGPVLLGVRRQDWRGRRQGALELGRKLAGRGEVAYWVDSPRSGLRADKSVDQRSYARERTRLRSAKVLDGSYRFVCHSRICDRSRDGLRLALAHDIALPRQLAVHLDETSEVREAEVVWRRGPTIGIRLRSAASAETLRLCDRYALRERYYAIPG
jgi:hypothetical protein